MASSRITATTAAAAALFLAVNLLLCALTATATATYCPPKHKKKTPNVPKIIPPPTKPPPAMGRPYYCKCPIDTLKLGVCVNELNGLVSAVVGKPPVGPCCSLLRGLADLEVAVCLCTAIKANVLGVNLNVHVSLTLLVNYCGCKLPRGFQCP